MNDIRAEVSKVLESLSSKKELNAQEKRDFMLISVFLRDPGQIVSPQAEKARTVEYEASGSIHEHAARYKILKQQARGGNAIAKQKSKQELNLLVLELNDMISEVATYTDDPSERETLKKINIEMLYQKC